MPNVLDVNRLSFQYDAGKTILDALSFSIRPGESVGLIGANGAGKSTLLKLLVGLETGFRGELLAGGLPVSREHLPAIRSKIGYVFQDSDSQLFMTTVGEDVAFAPRNYGCSEDEVKARTRRALQQVHIEYLENQSVYKLSGGEKKLASIATILSMEPELILLDEPSVALDPWNRRNLIHVINELPSAKLIASHDLDFILDTCERTILIGNGRIAADGETGAILSDQALLEQNHLELPLSLSHVIRHTHDGTTHTHVMCHEHGGTEHAHVMRREHAPRKPS